MPRTDPIYKLNATGQAVKTAADQFPVGKQRAAIVAAARVLLDGVVGIEYRVWPDDEPSRKTLEAQARDIAATARQLELLDGEVGSAVVAHVLDRLVREFGYSPPRTASTPRSERSQGRHSQKTPRHDRILTSHPPALAPGYQPPG